MAKKRLWEDLSYDDLMSVLEGALGPPPVGEANTLSEMQAARGATSGAMPTQGQAPPANMAALLGQFGVPAGQGFVDPRQLTQNPSYIPPHSGNVVQWLGGAMQPNKYENLLAGLGAANNIWTSMDLAKRQRNQAGQLANLSPEQAQQLMFLSMLQGGLSGGQ